MSVRCNSPQELNLNKRSNARTATDVRQSHCRDPALTVVVYRETSQKPEDWTYDTMNLLDPQPELPVGEKEKVALKHSAFIHDATKIKASKCIPWVDLQKPLWTCVYDENCTELYRAIEEERWWDVAHFLDSSKWPGISIVPDFPPEQQALTLVNHLNKEGDHVLWSLLPLHLAILEWAPPSVIGRLIDLAPMALTIPDHKGNLALHYAMAAPLCNEALAYILINSPEGIHFRNWKGYTPLDYALASKQKSAKNLGRMIQAFLKQHGTPKGTFMVKKPERVCDEPSPLYLGIQKKEWESVSHFLKTGDWPSNWILDLFGSLTNAKEGGSCLKEQVNSMVESKDQDGKVVQAVLPIHLAIIYGAPLDIICQLVDMYPKSLRIPDNQGMLPLHLAFYHNSTNAVIAHLLESFPASARIKSLYRKQIPIEVALECNKARGEILQLFLAANKQRHAANGTTVHGTSKE